MGPLYQAPVSRLTGLDAGLLPPYGAVLYSHCATNDMLIAYDPVARSELWEMTGGFFNNSLGSDISVGHGTRWQGMMLRSRHAHTLQIQLRGGRSFNLIS